MSKDLISREAVLEALRARGRELLKLGTSFESNIASVTALECVNIVKDVPAIDAVPVVHGRWEYHKGASVGGNDVWTCSECYRGYNWVDGFGYCPHCGAKMDGDCNG